MKKIVLIAVVALALTTATQAQDSTSGKMRQHPKMQHAQMFDELNLTQDQKDKMKKLREDNMQKMDAIKNNSSLSEDQRAEQMKALRTEQRKSMEDILTPEQKAKMKQLRDQRIKNHNGMVGTDSTTRR